MPSTFTLPLNPHSAIGNMLTAAACRTPGVAATLDATLSNRRPISAPVRYLLRGGGHSAKVVSLQEYKAGYL